MYSYLEWVVIGRTHRGLLICCSLVFSLKNLEWNDGLVVVNRLW